MLECVLLSCFVAKFCRISLFEFADLLIRHDVVNAINLDGGGSSQLIMDGTLASYPSDHWYGDGESSLRMLTMLDQHCIFIRSSGVQHLLAPFPFLSTSPIPKYW